MPVDFGKDVPHHVYLNGECTEVHFDTGALLYTITQPEVGRRGTGISTKHLTDAKTGQLKYILTQERDTEDIYQPPVYFITAVPPHEGVRVFKTGHGHIGRVFQDGYEICVSFRAKDEPTEIASLGPVEGGVGVIGDQTAPIPNKTTASTSESEGTNEEQGEGRVKRFLSKLFGVNKKHDRFVALLYDGRGKWIYLGANTPNPPPPPTAAAHPVLAAQITDDVIKKDIVVACKEAEDEKKGFLGLKQVMVEPGNEWLRDMVVAAWLVVLWEEERWSRLPGKLKRKGLEYLGGVTGGVDWVVDAPVTGGGTRLVGGPVGAK